MKTKLLYGGIGAAIAVALIVLASIGSSVTGSYGGSGEMYNKSVEDYGDTFTTSSVEEDSGAVNGNGAVYDEDASSDSARSESLFAEDRKGQKLVYTGDVTIGTDSIKKSYKKLTEKMEEYDAFFESVDESSSYKTMSIRVPKKDYMRFYESLSELDGTITSSNVNIQDKTKTYSDNEKRIDILQTEYNELKELMEKADTVEEILSIRDRMSQVTYDIELLKGSNDTIDYDSEYGRLELTLTLNGSHDEASFWHQLKEAFSSGIYLLKSLILGLVSIWWLILLAGYGVFAYRKRKWPFRNRGQHSEKKSAKADVATGEKSNSESKKVKAEKK